MTSTQAIVLERLTHTGNGWERDLCSPTLGKALAGKGWVERVKGAGASRLTSLAITEAGRAAWQARKDTLRAKVCD
jgi:hypothetical protein